MSGYDGQWYIHFSEGLGTARHATLSCYVPDIECD